MTTCKEVLNFFEESMKDKELHFKENIQTFNSNISPFKENNSLITRKEKENVYHSSHVPTIKPKNTPSIHTSSFSLGSRESASPKKDKNGIAQQEQTFVSEKGKKTVALKVDISRFSNIRIKMVCKRGINNS